MGDPIKVLNTLLPHSWSPFSSFSHHWDSGIHFSAPVLEGLTELDATHHSLSLWTCDRIGLGRPQLKVNTFICPKSFLSLSEMFPGLSVGYPETSIKIGRPHPPS